MSPRDIIEVFSADAVRTQLDRALRLSEGSEFRATWTAKCDARYYITLTKGAIGDMLVIETGAQNIGNKEFYVTYEAKLVAAGWDPQRRRGLFKLEVEPSSNDERDKICDLLASTMLDIYRVESSSVKRATRAREATEPDEEQAPAPRSRKRPTNPESNDDPTTLALGVVMVAVGVLLLGYSLHGFLQVMELQRISQEGSLFDQMMLEAAVTAAGGVDNLLDAHMRQVGWSAVGGLFLTGLGWTYIKQSKSNQ